MRRTFALFIVVLAASTGVACELLQKQDAEPIKSEPIHQESGAELFVSSGCSHCHRINGVGGVKGPDLSGIGKRWKQDALRRQIEQGALEMPAFKDILTDPQINSLVSYLHTRKASVLRK